MSLILLSSKRLIPLLFRAALPGLLWASFFAASFAAPNAFAAASAGASDTSAWPTTFSGQPDFEFKRKDVQEELKRKRGSTSSLPLRTPNLQNLLRSQEVDPLASTSRTTPSAQEGAVSTLTPDEEKKLQLLEDAFPNFKTGDTVTVYLRDGSVVQGKVAKNSSVVLGEGQQPTPVRVSTEGKIVEISYSARFSEQEVLALFQSILTAPLTAAGSASSQDPATTASTTEAKEVIALTPELMSTLSAQDKKRLSDFASFLETFIRQAEADKSANQKIDLQGRSYRGEIDKLLIQSITTSPQRSVVIFNRLYSVGDTFFITVQPSSTTPVVDPEKHIGSYMPKKEDISTDLFTVYTQMKDAAVKRYKAAQERAALQAGANTHKVSVRVDSIGPQRVTFSVFGKPYPVRLKLVM